MPSPGSQPAQSGNRLYPELSNRRRRVRQKAHLPIYASVTGSSSGMILDLSEVLDISEDGVCIRVASPLELSSPVTLSLDLVETKAFIHATGQVVWSDRTGRTGIRFPEVPEATRQHIRQWLFANAVSTSVYRPLNTERLVAPELPSRPELSAAPRPAVKQSPEQSRAAIAASQTVAENVRKSGTTDSNLENYSAVVSALGVVKRDVENESDQAKAMQLLADRGLSMTHATGAAIATADNSEAGVMICRASAGSDAPGIGARLQVGSGFSGECVRAGKGLRCDDTETDPRVDREGSRRLGIRSIMAAPVWKDNSVFGLIEVFSPQPNAFGPGDQLALRRLATMVGEVASRGRESSKALSLPAAADLPSPNLSTPETVAANSSARGCSEHGELCGSFVFVLSPRLSNRSRGCSARRLGVVSDSVGEVPGNLSIA